MIPDAPALVVDEVKCKRNIARMVEKAARGGVALRPHFKTHQSAAVGEWFRERGVDRIAVSSLPMARYFADHGWTDITCCIPANPRLAGEIDMLAGTCSLGILVDDPTTITRIDQQLTRDVLAWIEIDTGYGRTGIDAARVDEIARVAILARDARHIRLAGILTHAGQSYHARTREELLAIHASSTGQMRAIRDDLVGRGFEPCRVSTGDTPTCSVVDSFDKACIDEIRPGNFAFYDLTQVGIGSCTIDDIAVAVACPVISKPTGRDQVFIHGGAVHLSKDFIPLQGGERCFGKIARFSDDGTWGEVIDGARVVAVSQEHGTVTGPREFIDEVSIGDMIAVMPVHACLAANLVSKYVTTSGQELRTFRL